MSSRSRKSKFVECLEQRCLLHGGGAALSINAGGGAYVDSFGTVWTADANFSGGTASDSAFDVANTADDPLYTSRRFGSNFSYSIPVANGRYELELRFCDPFWAEAGKRKFNVKVEGVTVLSNYDIIAEAGPKAAIDKTFVVNITDGKLDLQFTRILDNAIISGIELNAIPATSAPAAASNLTATATSGSQIRLNWKDNSADEQEFAIQRSTDGVNFSDVEGVPANVTTFTDTSLSANTKYYYRVIAANDAGAASPSNVASATTPTAASDTAILRINAAGDPYTDSNGYQWGVDRNFSGGTLSTAAYDVLNTVDDYLYYTRRIGSNFSYSVPVANGTYTLKLFFADPFWNETGKRKFNVTAEGKTLLSNYDLVADVGAKTAAVKQFTVTISDGKLDLNFSKVLDNAIISGIALFPTQPQPQPGGDKITWQTSGVARIPDPKTEAQTAVVGNKMYVFGGFNSSAYATVKSGFVYDINANTWSAMADMPEPISHGAVAVDGTTIWVVGGWIGIPNNQIFGTKHVWKYDTLTNTWSAGPQLPADRGAGAAQIVGRELHFFGGTNLNRTMETGDHWVLNLDGGTTWQTRATMPLARNHLGSAVLDGKIYSIGGSYGHGDTAITQATVQRYDPATDTWTRVADLPTSRSHIYSSTFVMNGKIVVAGGDHIANLSINNVTAYDPATNTWSELTPLPSRRMAPMVKLVDGRIVAVGGSGEGVTAWDTVWIGNVS